MADTQPQEPEISPGLQGDGINILSLQAFINEINEYLSQPDIQAHIAAYDPATTPLNTIDRNRAQGIDYRKKYVTTKLFRGLRDSFEAIKADIADPSLPTEVKDDLAFELSALANYVTALE